MRNLEIVNMPCNSHLMTIEIGIGHTWIVGVNLEPIFFNVRAELLVELEGALKHAVEGFIHLHVK